MAFLSFDKLPPALRALVREAPYYLGSERVLSFYRNSIPRVRSDAEAVQETLKFFTAEVDDFLAAQKARDYAFRSSRHSG